MCLKELYRKYENMILAVLLLVLIGVFVAIRYDYYYALNDDVLIKDIISGRYMGRPASRNNQMLYPLSLAFSLIYKILPGVPWYALFEWGCHFGCLLLIVWRSLRFCRNSYTKWLLCVVEGLLIIGFFMEHLVFSQYTITSGLLAGTALFLFVTEKGTENLLTRSIPSIVLIVLAFLLRSEMLLLMLPFICVAGIYRWSCETKIFTSKNFRIYLGVFGCILAGLAVSFIVDFIGYSGEDWKDFRAYFDARTTLYDYTGIPVYEQNQKFYDSNEISKNQYDLLQNYNYGLDDEINTPMLEKVSAYAKGIQEGLLSRVKLGLIRYRYRITNLDAYPYCLLAALGYILGILALHRKNKGRIAFTLTFLFAVRSVIWVYILMTNRIPVRITHPLYFVEFLLLASVYLTEFLAEDRKEKERTYKSIFAIVLCFLLGSCITAYGIKTTDEQIGQAAENNVANYALQSYCAKNPDNFYFLDVYSSIHFTEKMFENKGGVSNYELLGGWICNSPIYREKLQNFGIYSVEEAFLTLDNVYLIQDTEGSFEWINEYFSQKGLRLEVHEVERLEGGLGVFQLEILE